MHFYGVCLCSDSDCSCKCYCDESQFELKKRLFPSGLGSRRAEGAEGRAKAKAVASASPWISHKPCEQDDCCMKCRYDSPCCWSQWLAWLIPEMDTLVILHIASYCLLWYLFSYGFLTVIMSFLSMFIRLGRDANKSYYYISSEKNPFFMSCHIIIKIFRVFT